jgi:hypothetical protein
MAHFLDSTNKHKFDSEALIDPNLPGLLAEAFVERMAAEGFELKHDETCLVNDFERILKTKRELFRPPIDRQRVSLTIEDNQTFDLETAAACFLGETLARKYSGVWVGFLTSNSAANFYTAEIRFSEYRFQPFLWLGYRLENGLDDTGDVSDLVQDVTPQMRDGIDYAQRKNDEARAIFKATVRLPEGHVGVRYAGYPRRRT